MIIRILGIIMIIVGVLALLLSIVSYFTAGIAPAIYFALLANFGVLVGRRWT